MLRTIECAVAGIGKPAVLGGQVRPVTAALAVILALSASSCGIFDTRDSEPPVTETPVPREEPLSPDAVLFNFTNAVEYFSQANYDETAAEDFEFIPDEEDRAYFISQGGNDIFQDWGKGEERTAAQRIFADSDTLAVTLTEISSTPVTDEVEIDMDYVFRRVIIRSGKPDSVAYFRGLARVHIRENQSGLWAIDKWTDFATPGDDRTWGFLKGTVTAD